MICKPNKSENNARKKYFKKMKQKLEIEKKLMMRISYSYANVLNISDDNIGPSQNNKGKKKIVDESKFMEAKAKKPR
jgi:hypothetical protein